jgi:cytochrome c-type biogenesis protein CcmF
VIDLGFAALVAAFVTAATAAGLAVYGGVSGDRRFVDASRRAVYAFAALLTTAVVVLEAAFLRDDFSFSVVAEHSSTSTPTVYKLVALWSSQEGSLLLWAFVLSLAASAVLYLTRRKHRELVPYATAVLMGLGTFFVGLMLFAANPFQELSPVPAEGVGLTPLLRHWAMVVHPPMLYTGYVMLSVPFAFAIAALITRKLDASWLRTTRRFALAAWTFLGIGLLLGSYWSYNELGWGGYWAWDPVENAALMPWLITTAFLHSIMVQERRGMLKAWNVSLICSAFVLALLGTFIVRSGILESIHAFGASTVGPPLLGLIAFVAIGSALLIASRSDHLRPERRIDSWLSRESVFLINNLLLVGMTLVILWGTLFPIISDAIGEERNFAEPLFNQLTRPLAVVLVLFTGIGPLLAWGRLSAGAVRRVLLPPALFAGAAAVALALGTDAADNPWALFLFAFAAFALFALTQEFWRAGSSRASLTGEALPRALPRAVARNRRRYGGYVVHAGIAILLVGIAASSSFQTNRDVRLAVGESAQVGDYTITYDALSDDPTTERIAFNALIDVDKDGEDFALLAPGRNYYPTMNPSAGPLGRYFEGEATSEIGLKSGLREDFWMAFQPDLSTLDEEIARGNEELADIGPEAQAFAILALAEVYAQDPPPATFRVIVNPFVAWLWIGALIAIAGAAVAIWPAAEARRRVRAAYEARLGQELKRA